jgi:hypothetical protein
MHFQETIWDKFKKEVEDISNEMPTGILSWYASEAKKFQYGYSLNFNNTTFRYYYIDNASQAAIDSRIIKKVSASEIFNSTFSGVKIKVAKEVGGALTKLTNAELTAFSFYMRRIAFAGVAIDIVSLDADIAKVNLRIYYDGIIPLDDIKNIVETSINDHLNAIEFDGILNRNKLIDSLQNASGIKDIQIIELLCKAAASISFLTVIRQYNPESGYFILQPIGDSSTDSQIEYIAV